MQADWRDRIGSRKRTPGEPVVLVSRDPIRPRRVATRRPSNPPQFPF